VIQQPDARIADSQDDSHDDKPRPNDQYGNRNYREYAGNAPHDNPHHEFHMSPLLAAETDNTSTIDVFLIDDFFAVPTEIFRNFHLEVIAIRAARDA
jgi:hypothetical protein